MKTASGIVDSEAAGEIERVVSAVVGEHTAAR
jgi:hypothetical protein